MSGPSISIIVAYARNRVIGYDGKLPWRIPEEMTHFRETTLGCPVIMGRKTWESLPDRYKPLPGRFNIVVSQNPAKFFGQFDQKQVEFVTSPHTALFLALGAAYLQKKEVYVIGGGKIYDHFLRSDLVTRVLASEVKADYEGNTFFPVLDPAAWERHRVKEYEKFEVVEYLKKKEIYGAI